MHLQKIGLLFLALLAANVSTSVPVNFLALFATAHAIAQEGVPKAIAQSMSIKAIAQTPNDQKLDQNPAANPSVSGSFVDYLAEIERLKAELAEVTTERDDYAATVDEFIKDHKRWQERALTPGKHDRILAELGVGKQSLQYKRLKAVLDQMMPTKRKTPCLTIRPGASFCGCDRGFGESSQSDHL
jgi:hypothetical protein